VPTGNHRFNGAKKMIDTPSEAQPGHQTQLLPSPNAGAVGFTDAQMAMIEDACRPLDRFIRSAFVAALGNLFSGKSEVGDGELHRAIVALQHEFMCPPSTTRQARPEKNFLNPSRLVR
jgi:hypothetical protein